MWAVIVLTCFLGLLIVLFSIPLRLLLTITVHDSFSALLTLNWFFGLIKMTDIGKSPTGERTYKLKPQSNNRKINEEKRFSGRDIAHLVLNQSLWRQVVRLLGKLRRRITVKFLNVDLKIGLDDPGNTWSIAAFALCISLFFHPPFPHSINIQPCFTDDFLLDGMLISEMEIIPLFVFPPIFQFIFSTPTFRAIKGIIALQWKKKA